MLSDDEIKREGRDAFGIDPIFDGNLMRFARAVERAAYERAAQECFERPYLEVLHDDYWTACKDCADSIRALRREK